MKKQLKQSTICNLMAIASSSMALFIFLAGMFTAILFSKVTALNSDQSSLSISLRHLITTVNYQKDMARSYTQDGNSMYLDMYHTKSEPEYDISNIKTSMTELTREAQGQKQLQAIFQNVEGMKEIEQNIINLVSSGKLAEARELAFGKDFGMLIDGLNQTVAEFEEGMSRGIGSIIKRQSGNVMTLGICIEVLCVILIIMQISTAITTKKLIVKPLIKLKAAMADMCGGHLSGNLDIQVDHTEVGELAGAMLEMRDRISSYIKEIDFVLQHISQKNISVQVENQYVGDFEPIHSSLNLIIESLTDTFSQLAHNIDQISGDAEHVSSAAQALAQGAAEQASSVDQLSLSINQVSAQIKSNASNASEANDYAVTAGASLASSNQQMSMMMSAMADISTSSNEISKIIKTIEDIAFQTNILALNAAVEAARAGAAGKGFAVVADEVRNLATKSSEAAKQTNALIESSVKSVDHGVKIANETAQSLSDVVTGSLAMADLITRISESSGEQSDSISLIKQGVEQISSVVQTNSATSEQSAAVSEQLSSQALIMKSMVKAYKVKGKM